MLEQKIIGYSNLFKGKRDVAIILIVLLVSAIYANSLGNSFAWDDYAIIVGIDFVKSWKNLPIVFSRAYLADSGELTYRPVVTLSYFIDYSIWRLNPFGYHLTNLLLHISNVVLLYFFIGLITRERKIALLTALFFGLHPVNSEAVNAIAFREDLLAFLFLASSVIFFIKSDYYPRKGLLVYAASIVMFLLALFSKEMAITLPILLVLYDYYFLFKQDAKKMLTRLKSRYLGYLAASLIFLWVWFFIMGDVRKSLAEYPGGSLYTNFLTISRVVATYIRWLLLPVDIHITLPYDSSYVSYSFFEPKVLFSISTIIVCLVLAIILHRRSKLISFALLWFFINLLPAFNIVPIINIMASRYLYVASAGFCLLIAVLLSRLPTIRISFIPPPILKKVAKDAVVVLVIFYSTFTIIRSLAWRNNIAVWTEAVEYYPHNAKAHRSLAYWLKRRGLLDKAISEYKTAIGLDPSYVMTYNDLGLCYYQDGLLDKAREEFKKALKLNPNWPEIYVNLGICYGEKKQHREAIDSFKQAIRLNPIYAEAYNNLGVTYANMKNYDQARKAWEKALKIEPEFKKAKDNLKQLDN